MKDINQKIAVFIKESRAATGLSQAEIADRLSVSLRAYQSWEKNYTSSVDNYLKICRLYQKNPAELLIQADTAAFNEQTGLLSSSKYREDKGMQMKRIIVEKSLQGDTAQEIHHWLTRKHPEMIEEGVDEAAYINNCILDVYHRSRELFFEKMFQRDAIKEQILEQMFELPTGSVIVSKSGHVKSQLLRELLLAAYGADLMIRWSREKTGSRIGIANGYTIAGVLNAIPRGAMENTVLFLFNFINTHINLPISSTALISSFLYRHSGYNVTADTTNEEQVFGSMQLVDAAFLGIGTFSQEGLYEKIIRTNLGQRLLMKIRNLKIVGDFNYHLIDNTGKLVKLHEIISDIGDFEHRSLIKSISLSTLREKSERGCPIVVAGTGEHKAEIIKIVMKSQYANHLITDTTVADRLIAR